MFRKSFGNIKDQFHSAKDPSRSESLRYEGLPGSRFIRLLRVSKDFTAKRIYGRFTCASLDGNPEFQAISYCWGCSDLVDKVWFDDHQYLEVTRSAAAVLRSIIKSKYSGHIWIDALCP
jgi:hypothetical protein